MASLTSPVSGTADEVKAPVMERRQLRTSLSPDRPQPQTDEVDIDALLEGVRRLNLDADDEVQRLNF